MRETLVWTGENPQVLEPNELVGREYQDADGRRGKIVANTGLSVTVEFPDPILPLRAVKAGSERAVGCLGAAIGAVNWDLALAIGFAAIFGIAMGLMMLSKGVPRP
jgi:hypothetical protein